ncbi:7-keto-8-aminopelargonate synthetase-like enzyme [Bradyrhizobium sp. LM6.10]
MISIIAGKVARYAAGLDALKDDDRLRSLGPRTGIDFSSNDYLALASAPRMKKAIVTALESRYSDRSRRITASARQLRGARVPRSSSGAVLRRAGRALLRRWLYRKFCGADNVAATGRPARP